MPHAVIDYSANIEEEVIDADVVNLVHSALSDSGLFQAKDIKTRAYIAGDYMVGEKGPDGNFVHVAVAILEGRSAEQKQKLSQSVFDAVRKELPAVDSLTVEIRELAKDSYRKIGG